MILEKKKEVIVMARTANIYTRVDPVVKEQAEEILDQLGIPMSNAIGMFLRQVVIHNGIPFDMKLPIRATLCREEMTKGGFDADIKKGYDDKKSGKVHPDSDLESHT